MKKTILSILLLITTILVTAQNQTVNGNLTTTGSVTVGKQVSATVFGSVNRLSLTPYRHTGGLWTFTSRDVPEVAYLDIAYGNTNILAFHHKNGIGIFTTNPTCALDVRGGIKGTQLDINGTIRAKGVKIEATGWSDFVFDKDYRLLTLSEIESHINEHKHLPDIPSQKEVLENGIDVGDMQAKLLQKIEELTLYVIEQDKKIQLQQKRIEDLEKK